MTSIRFFIHLSAVLFLANVHCFQKASAAPMVFLIDDSQSQVAISGALAGQPFSAQGPGSLTASYEGSINVDLTDNALQFTGGSIISAETNGVWEPAVGGSAGSAPADYGATNSINVSIGAPFYIPGNTALRNMVFDLTSPALALTNGSFAGNNLVFSFITNTATFDYNYEYDSGSSNLNGDSTNSVADGTMLSTNGGVRTLTIQINAQFQFALITENDSTIDLSGQLVATNVDLLPPPDILSVGKNGQDLVLITLNTTAQSLLLASTNLSTWSPASAVITTNGGGMIVFSTPLSGPHVFYRVQQ